MASKKLSVTIQPDLGRVNDFERVTAPYKGSLMVSFDILDDKNVSMEYVSKKNSAAGDDDRDYCFSGLMFSKENGMFYAYPDSARTFIPLLDATKYFKIVAKKSLGIDIEPPADVLDGLFQTVKLAIVDGKGNLVGSTPSSKNTPVETLLSQVLSYFSDNSKQRTVIGKLLYNEYGSSNATLANKVSKEDSNKFFAEFSLGIMDIMEAYNKVMASVKNRTKDGLVNTNLNVQNAISDAFEENAYQLLRKDVEESGIPHTQELSANFFFNPTVRSYYDALFLKNGKKKAASNKVHKNLETVVLGMNAADLMTDPNSGIITALSQFGMIGKANDSDYENDLTLNDISVNGTTIMKAGEVEKLIKVYDGEATDTSAVISAIQNIDDSGEVLENPSIYILTDRAIKNMTLLLKAMNSQTLKKKKK